MRQDKEKEHKINLTDKKRSHFQPKSYRIDPLYEIIFEAAANIYGNDKTDLMFSLLQEGIQVDVEQLKNLPQLNKTILMETMLDNLKSVNKPIDEMRTVFREERILNLTKILTDKHGQGERTTTLIALRIMPSYSNFINKYAQKRKGEPVELAIALFIVNSSIFEFELLKTVFTNLVEK